MRNGGYNVCVYFVNNGKSDNLVLCCANYTLALEVLRGAEAMIGTTSVRVDALDQYGKPAYTVKTVEVRK